MQEKSQTIDPRQEVPLEEKTTLVIGASTNPDRYSNKAIHMLRDHDVPVLALGLREGEVRGVSISKDPEDFRSQDIHTVTLYLNPYRQEPYYDYIISLKPERVVFNPGTENRVLAEKLAAAGIQPVEACTLVMLTLQRF